MKLPFGSKIKVIENNSKFLKFANGWIKKMMLNLFHIKKKILLEK